MKLSFRFILTAILLVALIAFGLESVATHFGQAAATGAFLLVLSLSAPAVSTQLGVTAVSRDTQVRDGVTGNYPMAAATLIPLGVMVALDASGNAVNAADTAGLRVIGRSEQTVDNSAGLAGALTINVRRGVFKWINSAAQPVTAAYKDKQVYAEDNDTVAISTTNKVHAGRVIEVASDGVWVDSTDKATAAAAVTTVGAAVVAIAGGESPTEAEHNALITRINELRVDLLALVAKVNGG